MFYTWGSFVSTIAFTTLLGHVDQVSSARIPVRAGSSDIISRGSHGGDGDIVALPAMPEISKYVCPSNKANSVKRQDSPTTMVHSSDLRIFLQQLRAYELQIVALVDQSSGSASTLPSAGAEISGRPLSAAVDSVLASMTGSVASACVTATVTATITQSTDSTSFAAPATSTPSAISTSSVALTSSVTVPGGAFLESPVNSRPTASSSLATNTSSSASTAQPTTNPAGYTFNAASTSNVAVYFGQTPATGQTTLEAQCADPNVDIVILAFVISMTGQYPTVNFGAACGGTTAKMQAEAPGLLYCPELAGYISNCQTKYGKKVLLSIGGAISQFSLATPGDASSFANTLWELFGPPGKIDNDLRPFGTVSIDGFDIDKEDHLPNNWDTLATSLKALYATSPTKHYYLSSAPQCPFPDASNPLGLILNCDFVFVQFYNNPPCEIRSSGFSDSLKQWDQFLDTSSLATKPKLYIGAPAFAAAGQTAYANLGGPEGMREVSKEVRGLGLRNLGGVMFWDGAEGMDNFGAGGMDIIALAKEGLTS